MYVAATDAVSLPPTASGSLRLCSNVADGVSLRRPLPPRPLVPPQSRMLASRSWSLSTRPSYQDHYPKRKIRTSKMKQQLKHHIVSKHHHVIVQVLERTKQRSFFFRIWSHNWGNMQLSSSHHLKNVKQVIFFGRNSTVSLLKFMHNCFLEIQLTEKRTVQIICATNMSTPQVKVSTNISVNTTTARLWRY
jgi:hypothetical protein